MREWIKYNPLNQKRLEEDDVMKTLSETPQKYTICFDKHPDANPESRKANLKRFALNPQPNWGPKPKASRMIPREVGLVLFCMDICGDGLNNGCKKLLFA